MLSMYDAEGVAGSNMAGVIVLTGRAKDTIVLSSGENIEPGAIEDAAVCSPLIKFCMVLGQDRRSLGALIVPDAEAFEEQGQMTYLATSPRPYGAGLYT